MSAVESWSVEFYKGNNVKFTPQSYRGTKEEVTKYILDTMYSQKHIDEVVTYEASNGAIFRYNFPHNFGRSTDVSSYSNKHRGKLCGCNLQKMETIQ